MTHVLIDWTGEFDRWWQNIEERRTLDTRSRQIAGIVGTQLDFLQELDQVPVEDSLQVRRVVQSKMGDIFYDGVGNRADFLIREYLRDEEN